MMAESKDFVPYYTLIARDRGQSWEIVFGDDNIGYVEDQRDHMLNHESDPRGLKVIRTSSWQSDIDATVQEENDKLNLDEDD